MGTRPIELIEWRDAATEVGWEAGDNNLTAALVLSVGIIASENKDQIVLASTFCPDDDMTNNRIVIPKVWVASRVVIHKHA